jgi:hypothetical protein
LMIQILRVDKGRWFRLMYLTFFEIAKNVRSKPVNFE